MDAVFFSNTKYRIYATLIAIDSHNMYKPIDRKLILGLLGTPNPSKSLNTGTWVRYKVYEKAANFVPILLA